MRLQLSTWPEVERYLASSRGIILPIGSTEQHGPTGLIGTDALCAEAIAERVGEAAGAMVGPTIGVGMAQHHMAFPGTVTLRPSTLVLVVRDMVLSLAEHGFDRFLFINGHGGNVATVRTAFSEIHAETRAARGQGAPDLRLKLMNWWDAPAVGRLARELYGGSDGAHATASEIAVTQALFPDHIKTAPLEPKVAPLGAYHDARDFRRRHPDGRMGSDPSLARPEHGQRLMEAAVPDLAAAYQALMKEP
ncbi:MAG TPA: creatininase family protein [Alphaproteobacteria bacterium]|nr:creatininase family protein [Alphaproteobacteria bacterium]